MSLMTFDASKHPRAHGRFVSARGAAAIASAPDSVRYSGGVNSNHAIPGFATPVRSLTRGEGWQRIGNRINAIPASYTGEKTKERPVGSFLHLTITNQIPASMPVKEHHDRVARYIKLVKDSRQEIMDGAEKNRAGKKHVYLKANEPAARGVAKWRMKPDLYPEGTSKGTLNRAYNHAALIHMHERGLVQHDFKMDDDLKAEMKPVEPFIRYAVHRLRGKTAEHMAGEHKPYLDAFGQDRQKVFYGKPTGKVSRRFKPNQQLVKAFDPNKHNRARNGEFSQTQDYATGAAVGGGAAALGGSVAFSTKYVPAAIQALDTATGHRKRVQAAYRQQVKAVKAAGGQIVYRGAPTADPLPKPRGFTSVYVARTRDIANMYGHAHSRYAIGPEHKFLDLHDPKMKQLFPVDLHRVLPKTKEEDTSRTTAEHVDNDGKTQVYNLRLYNGLKPHQSAKLKEMGYAGAESPQIERGDAYVLQNHSILRYLGTGFHSDLRGGRLAYQISTIARRAPEIAALSGSAAVAGYALRRALAKKPKQKLAKAFPIGAFRSAATRAAGAAARGLDSMAAPAGEQRATYDRMRAGVHAAHEAFAGTKPGGLNRAGYSAGRAAATGVKRFVRNPLRSAKVWVKEGARAGSGFGQGVSDAFGGGERTRRVAGRVGGVLGAAKPLIIGAAVAKPAMNLLGLSHAVRGQQSDSKMNKLAEAYDLAKRAGEIAAAFQQSSK